jgi:hypothetical protein
LFSQDYSYYNDGYAIVLYILFLRPIDYVYILEMEDEHYDWLEYEEEDDVGPLGPRTLLDFCQGGECGLPAFRHDFTIISDIDILPYSGHEMC